MGLDASVMCRCFQDGLVELPHFGKHIFIDDEGYLNLDLPKEEVNLLFGELFEWEQTACKHERMCCASERISNWGGYRLFQGALREVGWSHFPVLKAELPNVNGGLTVSARAQLMQKELEDFLAGPALESGYALYDTETDERLHQYIEAYEGVFLMSGKAQIEAGLNRDGFFIRDRESKQIHFQTTAFMQILLEPEKTEAHQGGLVRYLDLSPGQEFECRAAISGKTIPWPDGKMQNEAGKMRFDYPTLMHTAEFVRSPEDYRYVVDPLLRICRASIETGNPIRWS